MSSPVTAEALTSKNQLGRTYILIFFLITAVGLVENLKKKKYKNPPLKTIFAKSVRFKFMIK